MYQKFVLVIGSLFLLALVLASQESSYGEVDISTPYALTMNDERILTLAVHTQAILQVEIQNKDSSVQEYVAIVEVRDSQEVTIYLQFQKGKLPPNGSIQLGISWMPTEIDTFLVRSFVISGLDNPVVISPATSAPLDVGKELEIDAGQVEIQIEESNAPNVPKKEPTIGNLRQYALKKINEDRQKFGLEPVQLSNNFAAQLHAEDNLESKAISHWMSNGEKPYMTYTNYGGLGFISQNVAMTGDLYSDKDCKSGLYECEKIEPFQEIDLHQYGLVYDDFVCCDDGHRDNILDTHHTHVSIGIAYDDYNFVMVQNFENIHLELDEKVDEHNGYVKISGELLKGNLYGIGVYYDRLPTVDEYNEHRDDTYYDSGELVASVVQSAGVGYYYEQPDDFVIIEAKKWEIDGNEFDLEFNISPVFDNGDGVYTFVILLEEAANEPFEAYSYSIYES